MQTERINLLHHYDYTVLHCATNKKLSDRRI